MTSTDTLIDTHLEKTLIISYMNTENVLVSLTVVLKFSTVFQSRSEKHRTVSFSKNWWRTGYGMRSHPIDKTIFILLNSYLHLYIYIFSNKQSRQVNLLANTVKINVLELNWSSIERFKKQLFTFISNTRYPFV